MMHKSMDSTAVRLMVDSANGDDRNLVDHGGYRQYWYSVSDGFRLLQSIRKSSLHYDPSIPVIPGEEFSADRENQDRVFIADPYHTLSFSTALNDDIDRITGVGTAAKRWKNMPDTLVVTMIDGIHWRSIRVQIDYDKKEINLLFDDPYGVKSFSQELQNTMVTHIIDNVSRLIQCDHNIKHNTILNLDDIKRELQLNVRNKEIDQQGKNINGYDCGPIAFRNAVDYANPAIRNEVFASGNNYTITLSDHPRHEELMAQIRERISKDMQR